MISTVAVLLALAAPAFARDVAPGFAVTYLCEGNAVLQVAYLNPEGAPSLAVVNWGGRLVPMQEGPTGSGVRYVALDPQDGLVWHGKGPEGALLRDGDAPATLLGGCREAGS